MEIKRSYLLYQQFSLFRECIRFVCWAKQSWNFSITASCQCKKPTWNVFMEFGNRHDSLNHLTLCIQQAVVTPILLHLFCTNWTSTVHWHLNISFFKIGYKSFVYFSAMGSHMARKNIMQVLLVFYERELANRIDKTLSLSNVPS